MPPHKSKQPLLPNIEFSQNEIEKLSKPISPAHGFSIAFWFLTQVGDPKRAQALLDVAIYASDKLKALASTAPANNNEQ